MRAVYFDRELEFRDDYPEPELPGGEALIRPVLAGICNTDLEITRGYFGFSGVLGHEFVGIVEMCPSAPDWEGRRVVGEINANCRECPTCRRGDATHCPNRTTLGIFRRDGAMADRVTLPVHLLHEVPDGLDNDSAVFTEPLAAACEITERLPVAPTDRVVVLGDGKLGLLIAQVLQLTGCDLEVIGRHEEKLEILRSRGIRCRHSGENILGGADYVVEATGSAEGFATARSLVRPRGTIILKSTYHGELTLNMSMVVVDEVTLHGSRCGPFPPALRLLRDGLVDVKPMIHDRFSLNDGNRALERAGERGILKVLLEM